MKTVLAAILICFSFSNWAQNLKPNEITISYFGETITHPGIRIGATYNLNSWEKLKTTKKGLDKSFDRSLDFKPSLGFFYHKNYQTAFFALPELAFSRKKGNGKFISFSAGIGYMRTVLPNVYELNEIGEIQKSRDSYNYYMSSIAFTFGKDLSLKRNIPLTVYSKPQFMYTMPNYNNGVLYFTLEIGVSFKFVN